MIQVPLKLQKIFESWLVKKSIAQKYYVHDGRWLRFYLDFCKKYDRPYAHDGSLDDFLEKLREKRQKPFQIRQAEEAVRIYYEIVEEGRARNCQRSGEQGGERIGDCRETGPKSLGKTPTSVCGEKKETSGAISSIAEPNVPGFEKNVVNGRPQKVCENVEKRTLDNLSGQRERKGTGLIETGTDWRPAFEGLTSQIKVRHYSPKTLKTYAHWLRKFQAFTKSKQLEALCDKDITDFMTWLAVKRNMAASTQNQAFNSVLFFFRHVLGREPGDLKNSVRAKRKPYIPVVLSRNEIEAVLAHLSHPYDLAVRMLYGCGLRLFECLKLRINNFNLDAGILAVHDGKGKKDRTVPLPESLTPAIRDQFESVFELHEKDLASGYAGAFMMGLLDKKYKNAAKEFVWQWFFPAIKLTKVPETGQKKRYHLHERHVQREIKEASRKAKLFKRVSAHTFVTALLPICCRPITTYEPSRTCWDTAISEPQ